MLMTHAPTEPVTDVELYQLGVYVTGKPHAVWHKLRSEAPVVRQSAPTGAEFWSVSCYRDVRRVLRDTTLFTSEHTTMLSVLDGDEGGKGRAINLVDGPRHTALRTPTLRLMTAAVMREREPVVRQRIRKLVGSWTHRGDVDIAAELAIMPMLVAGDLIGIPADYWAHAAHWTMASIAPDDPLYAVGSVAETLTQAHMELFAMFTELMAERRARPGPDLISALTAIEAGGQPLDDHDAMVNIYAFVMGASITTPQVISHLALVMADDPDLWRDIRSDPSLWHSTMEEAVRWSSPINHVVRLATGDCEIGGHAIRSGDLVCSWIASADRDEEVFTDPYTFDPRRSPNPHLAFGFGPHHCIGVHLARTALVVTIAELAERVSRFERTGPVHHLASNFLNGVTSLPMRLRG